VHPNDSLSVIDDQIRPDRTDDNPDQYPVDLPLHFHIGSFLYAASRTFHAISTKLIAPSFSRTCRRWPSTVRSPIPNLVAISFDCQGMSLDILSPREREITLLIFDGSSMCKLRVTAVTETRSNRIDRT
jgi:hypothetical protein